MRPRQYAAQIINLPTREERKAALERVPEEWREMTRKHVEIAFERRAMK